jgi:hypothetical protein
MVFVLVLSAFWQHAAADKSENAANAPSIKNNFQKVTTPFVN